MTLPRDVLADVVSRWVENDADLYGYVDTLINALDKAGCNPNDVAELRSENGALRDLCCRAADSAAGYSLIGGVYAELRAAASTPPPAGTGR